MGNEEQPGPVNGREPSRRRGTDFSVAIPDWIWHLPKRVEQAAKEPRNTIGNLVLVVVFLLLVYPAYGGIVEGVAQEGAKAAWPWFGDIIWVYRGVFLALVIGLTTYFLTAFVRGNKILAMHDQMVEAHVELAQKDQEIGKLKAEVKAHSAHQTEVVERRAAELERLFDRIGDWQFRLAGLALALMMAETKDDLDNALDKFVVSILWDVGRVLGEGIMQSGSVSGTDPSDAEWLILRHLAGIEEARRAERRFYVGMNRLLEQERGITGLAWVSDDIVLVQDVMKDERYAVGPTAHRPYPPYAAIIATPIYVEGEKIAVMCIDGRTAHCFDEEFAPMVIRSAGGFVASAMHLRDRWQTVEPSTPT